MPVPTGSRLIDVVLPDLHSGWANRLVFGLELAAREHDLSISLTTAPVQPTELSAMVKTRRSRAVVAAMISMSTSDIESLRTAHVPHVVIDPTEPLAPGVPSITATNAEGCAEATEHLVALGHRRIGLIGNDEVLATREREQGFRAALAASGLTVPDALLSHTQISHAAAERAFERMMAAPEPPTAVVAVTDQMAIGVLVAARRLGISVPDDVSVVGFDDLPEADRSVPRLTTVHQPITDIAAEALRMVLEPPDEPPGFPIRCPTHLVVRDSSASPPISVPRPPRP
ncbi:LacI family DNA-binding transcriptional regulator [Phytoactinopolyspora endophytica]|uniref:LacI family DNA-binding transcriptional regulator n=1 Tax=Phytoactinopolyspora endophytica TaxID=1642495 RepID=UPI001F11136D|nr:substrate-binding domain-containing protein [Phytoactinopolyspora endophytica]